MSLWRSSEMMMLLLLLLLLELEVSAQSGEGQDNTEERGLSCSADISKGGNQLRCELLGGWSGNKDEEDEDGEEKPDAILTMSLCATDYTQTVVKVNCVKKPGNVLNFTELPVSSFNLTVHLRRGGVITSMVDMKKIVKPRTPSVYNVTFSPESNVALIHVSTPYVNDYLSVDNQLFQLKIWSSTRPLFDHVTYDTAMSEGDGTSDVTGFLRIQNMTSEATMRIEMLHLHRNRRYLVKVRALPLKALQGVWSEWSGPYRFQLPEGPVPEDDTRDMAATLVLGLVSVVVVIVSGVFFWKKNRIFTYMWPNIPHPKDTLVHLCKPNKHLLLNFNPEVYSALNVAPLQMKPIRCDLVQSVAPPKPETFHSDPVRSTDPGLFPNLVQPQILHSDPVQSGSLSFDSAESTELLTSESGVPAEDLCSTQSSDCRSTTSISTEESEVAALLDRSCSDGDNVLQSSGANLVAGSGDGGGSGPQDEAYVTMSSFYQTK